MRYSIMINCTDGDVVYSGGRFRILFEALLAMNAGMPFNVIVEEEEL